MAKKKVFKVEALRVFSFNLQGYHCLSLLLSSSIGNAETRTNISLHLNLSFFIMAQNLCVLRKMCKLHSGMEEVDEERKLAKYIKIGYNL